MFSGADDGKIIVWMIRGWLKLCELSQDYVPISIIDLEISDDNMILMAKDKMGVLTHWQLEDNGVDSGAITMKINANHITQTVMSKDCNFMAAVTYSGIQLWNIKTEQVYDLTKVYED